MSNIDRLTGPFDIGHPVVGTNSNTSYPLMDLKSLYIICVVTHASPDVAKSRAQTIRDALNRRHQ